MPRSTSLTKPAWAAKVSRQETKAKNRYSIVRPQGCKTPAASLFAYEYFVRGCTALLDAVGGAIHHIGNAHKYAREEDRPEKTLFVITTDGMENASRFYSYDRVRAMIQHQQGKYGWEFLFLGANIDAAEEAGRFGIRPECAADYHADSQGTEVIYESVCEAVHQIRSCEAPLQADWKRRIEQDLREGGAWGTDGGIGGDYGEGWEAAV